MKLNIPTKGRVWENVHNKHTTNGEIACTQSVELLFPNCSCSPYVYGSDCKQSRPQTVNIH